MKFIPPFLLLPFLFTLSLWSASPVPYSGKIDIRGVNYFGEAQFAFSLHDGNGTTHWRNGKQPGETIKVTIRNGRYNVLLGGQGMNSLAPELFLNHDKLYLKVEVNMEDGEGLRHLAPDQLITTTPRALVADIAKVAQVAEKVDNGVITRDMLSSEVLAKLDANGSSASIGPITRDMLPQDVRDDLNKTVTITREMLPQDVRDDLNATIGLERLSPAVRADLNRTITKSMLGSDVLNDLNRTIIITRDMLPQDVIAELNASAGDSSSDLLSMIVSLQGQVNQLRSQLNIAAFELTTEWFYAESFTDSNGNSDTVDTSGTSAGYVSTFKSYVSGTLSASNLSEISFSGGREWGLMGGFTINSYVNYHSSQFSSDYGNASEYKIKFIYSDGSSAFSPVISISTHSSGGVTYSGTLYHKNPFPEKIVSRLEAWGNPQDGGGICKSKIHKTYAPLPSGQTASIKLNLPSLHGNVVATRVDVLGQVLSTSNLNYELSNGSTAVTGFPTSSKNEYASSQNPSSLTIHFNCPSITTVMVRYWFEIN
jgi:predicted regulator of amino acid metabolism with ACT domain